MSPEYIFSIKDLRKVVPPKREILRGIWLSFSRLARFSGEFRVTLSRWLAACSMCLILPAPVFTADDTAEALYQNRSLSAWSQDLKTGTLSERVLAADALRHFGAPAVMALVQGYKDEEVEVRMAVSKSLQDMGPALEAAVPMLIPLLDDSRRATRISAISMLQTIGPPAAPAVPRIAQALNDPEPDVRIRAAVFLKSMGKQAQMAVPALIDILKSGPTDLQGIATQALFRIGRSTEAFDFLRRSLDSHDAGLQKRALTAIGEVGEPAAAVSLQVARLTLSENQDIQEAANFALPRLGPAAKKAIPVLTDALSKGTSEQQVRAAAACAALEGNARAAMPALISAYETKDPKVRVTVLGALAAIDPKSPRFLSLLRRGLGDSDEGVREVASNVREYFDIQLDAPPHSTRIPSIEDPCSGPLHEAVKCSDVARVTALLDSGADIEAAGAGCSTPLYIAAGDGNVDVARVLLDHGAKLTVKWVVGTTVLHAAAGQGHVEMIELLLSRGADVNADDDERQTPLHLAAQWGKVPAIETLVRHGAKLEVEDKPDCLTPLQRAVQWRQKAAVDRLISLGASSTRKNCRGETALDLAHQGGSQEIIRLLESTKEQ